MDQIEILLILQFWTIEFSENFILADEPCAKTLQIFETFISVNDNLYGKLVSSLEVPIKFDERLKVTLDSFFYSRF